MPAETVIPPDTIPLRDSHLISWRISTDSTADFQSLLAPPGLTAHSFFTSHGLKVREIRPVNFSKYQPDWILGILLLSFILLAWAQMIYPRRLRQVLMAPYSKRFLSQLIRDGDLFSERIALATGFIYVTTISLFIFELFKLTPAATNSFLPQGFMLFALISIGVSGFWILKIGLIRFLSFIFRTRQTTREYILNILIFNIVTGLFVLPFLVLTIYLKSDMLLWVCIIIFVLCFFFRFARGFLIGISITKFSWLFLFVYLCSLEILPLVVVIKVVLRYCL
jgi:hypothetical protein